MHFSILLSVLFCASAVRAAGKTSIYIDDIALYSELPACAEERVSAIVRAQSYGCGDDMQLTSFSCFCVDSSSEFASMISTDVQASCSIAAATATLTSPAAVVTSALDLFQSYCSQTTKLKSSTPTQLSTSTITAPPQTTVSATQSPSSAQSKDKKSTLVAAIVAPVVVVSVLVLAALLFIPLRRRMQHRHASRVVYDTKEVPSELVVNEVKRSEMEGSGVVYYAHELPSNMETAELDGKAIESRSVKRSSGGK